MLLLVLASPFDPFVQGRETHPKPLVQRDDERADEIELQLCPFLLALQPFHVSGNSHVFGLFAHNLLGKLLDDP